MEKLKITDEIYENDAEEQGPTSRLKDGINVRNLIDSKEVDFEVQKKSDDDENEGSARYFDRQMVEHEFLNDGTALGIDEESDSEDSETSTLTPFERLEKKMHDISGGEELVLKMVKKQGSGDVVPEDATVRVHYSASVEYSDTPFDSSYLREKPFQFRINSGSVVQGLDIAVATMRRNEVSYFLVKPKYGFGELGCPPRIPPNSILLYKVELLGIVNDAAAARYRQLDVTERETLTFEQVCQACRAERESGNHFFNLSVYKKALSCYRRATNMLEDFHLKNDVEESKQQELLYKCYLNLAMCWLKLNKAPPTITECNKALEIKPRSAKALFRKAKAYKMLQEFGTANKFLKMALRVEPNNNEIIAELKSVSDKIKEAIYVDQALYSKMFTYKEEPQKEKKQTAQNTPDLEISQEFEEYIAEKLEEIMETDEIKELKLPGNLTPNELGFTKLISQKYGLKMVNFEVDGKMVTKITK